MSFLDIFRVFAPQTQLKFLQNLTNQNFSFWAKSELFRIMLWFSGTGFTLNCSAFDLKSVNWLRTSVSPGLGSKHPVCYGSTHSTCSHEGSVWCRTLQGLRKSACPGKSPLFFWACGLFWTRTLCIQGTSSSGLAPGIGN